MDLQSDLQSDLLSESASPSTKKRRNYDANLLHTRRNNFWSTHPKNLMVKRKRTDLWNIIKKAFSLLTSPRTILIQLESFLFIILIRIFDSDGFFTKNFGMLININVISLIVSFCIIFAINQSFARRERTLQDFATLKSNIILTYYTISQIYAHDSIKKQVLYGICHNVFHSLSKYIYDQTELIPDKLYSVQQNRELKHFYSNINRLIQFIYFPDGLTRHTAFPFDVNKRIHKQKDNLHLDEIEKDDDDYDEKEFKQGSAQSLNGLNVKLNPAIQVLLTNQVNNILQKFEHIVATKDYQTPLALRAFTTLMMWVLPIILAPYFLWSSSAESADHNVSVPASCGWSWLFFLLFGALCDIKSILDDIFDGDSFADDIILDNRNILKNMKYGSSPFVQDLYHQSHNLMRY